MKYIVRDGLIEVLNQQLSGAENYQEAQKISHNRTRWPQSPEKQLLLLGSPVVGVDG